jgi:prefoldin beta subunit
MQQLQAQKQRMDLEMNESERALKTLEDLAPEAKVYKSVGAILVEKKKEEVIKELEDRRDFLEMRSQVLDKQEKKTRERLDELQETLRKELNIPGTAG